MSRSVARLLLLAAARATRSTSSPSATPLPDGQDGGNGWRYAGAPWSATAAGKITAPAKTNSSCGETITANCTHPTNGTDVNVAFFASQTLVDFEVSVDFTIKTAFTAAGLVFGGALKMMNFNLK